MGVVVVRPCGEDAFVLEFGDRIDSAVGRRVAAAARALEDAAPAGLVEVVPTFRSLLVLYDPDVTSEAALVAAAEPAGDIAPEPPAAWRVPVCMSGAEAEDLAEAAAGLGLTEADVREIFLGGTYQVGMYGFAPGFAYLSGVDPALAIPRRASPRPPMPVGSLILAGGMAALTSVSMPTGWYVVGQTAITLFRPDRTPMVPFAVGDTIRFRAIDARECAALKADPDGGVVRE